MHGSMTGPFPPGYIVHTIKHCGGWAPACGAAEKRQRSQCASQPSHPPFERAGFACCPTAPPVLLRFYLHVCARHHTQNETQQSMQSHCCAGAGSTTISAGVTRHSACTPLLKHSTQVRGASTIRCQAQLRFVRLRARARCVQRSVRAAWEICIEPLLSRSAVRAAEKVITPHVWELNAKYLPGIAIHVHGIPVPPFVSEEPVSTGGIIAASLRLARVHDSSDILIYSAKECRYKHVLWMDSSYEQ